MSQHAFRQTKKMELLQLVAERLGPLFNIDDVHPVARELGMSAQDVRWTLYSLARSGWVQRIKRGVYALQSPLVPQEIHPYALADALVEPMAISHWSALSHHGLTTQIPPMVQASTPKKVVTPEMREGRAERPRGRAVWQVLDVEIEFIFVEQNRFFGFQQAWVDEWHRVSITDRERTLLDLVARQDLFGGLALAIDTYSQYLNTVDIGRLVEYACRYDMGSVIKRLGWLLEEVGVPNEELKRLEEYPVSNYYRLDPSRPRLGQPNTRWQIIDNQAGESSVADHKPTNP